MRPRVGERRKGTRTKQELSIREWTCLNCGAVHDRDVNAAVNIRGALSLTATLRDPTAV